MDPRQATGAPVRSSRSFAATHNRMLLSADLCRKAVKRPKRKTRRENLDKEENLDENQNAVDQDRTRNSDRCGYYGDLHYNAIAAFKTTGSVHTNFVKSPDRMSGVFRLSSTTMSLVSYVTQAAPAISKGGDELLAWDNY